MTAARRALLVQMVPPDAGPVADVGADHGKVAAALHAAGHQVLATERAPHRRSKARVPWVVADGLTAFRTLGVAVVAGMGAHKILDILRAAPPLKAAVLHAMDSPSDLRRGLAEQGWRIQAEGLAPEARAYATVLRAVPDTEPSSGMWLHHGPHLMRTADTPHLRPHLDQQIAWFERVAGASRSKDPKRSAWAQAHADFLRERRTALLG